LEKGWRLVVNDGEYAGNLVILYLKFRINCISFAFAYFGRMLTILASRNTWTWRRRFTFA
jgi:hypothetical protein